jgi:5-methylcytosine-specific restriction endonuclease McrA
MSHTAITRAQARALGLTRYFTGKPCRHGHVDERITATANCLACLRPKLAAKRRKWRRDNPDKARAAKKRWRDANGQTPAEVARKRRWYEANQAQQAERSKQWMTNHPERAREISRKRNKRWYAANREQEARRHSEWSRANPGQARIARDRYRNRKRGVKGAHTLAEADALLRTQKYRCASCRADLRKTKKSKDHIIPISKGGADDIRNIQWLCFSCNCKKKDKDPLVFARQNGRLL